MIFRLYNFSDNPVYTVKIILDCASGRNLYAYYGWEKHAGLILCPSDFCENYQSVLIKFKTSLNEVGYVKFEINESPQYFWMQGTNKNVKAYNEDKIIDSEDKIVQYFKNVFDNNQASFSNFKYRG